MTIFGITIPLWAIVVIVVALFVFRNELKSLLSKAYNFLFHDRRPPQPDPHIQALVLQALSEHGVKVGDNVFDGGRLIAVLKSFRDFLGVIANMTPSRVDDIAVNFVHVLVGVLEKNPDVANMIAKFINLLVLKSGSQNKS